MRIILALLLCVTAGLGADRRALLVSKKPEVAASSYTASSTRFTTDDYLSHSATLTNGTGTNGMLSFWIKAYASGSEEAIFLNSGSDMRISKLADGTIKVRMKDNIGPNTLIDIRSTASVDGGAWHHVAATWSTNADVDCKVYIDGTEGTTIVTRAVNGNPIAYDWTTHRIGHSAGSMNCDISEFWYAPKQRIDLASNITKFRSAGGAPVSLGADGSTPTGAKPTLYIKDPFTSLVNLGNGSGGDFTVTAGTLTAGSAIP